MKRRNGKRTGLRAIVAAALLIGLMAGCGSQADLKPVAIQEGVDRCTQCNMMIADDANATEIVLKDGKALKFDDLGDLFTYKKQHDLGDTVGAQYVRDLKSKEWVKLEEASFVFDPSFQTPMAYGVLSFKSKADAEAFIKEQGKGQLLTAADLAGREWKASGGMKGMDGMKGSGGMDGTKGANGSKPDMQMPMKDMNGAKENKAP